jgi:hypothetical protein
VCLQELESIILLDAPTGQESSYQSFSGILYAAVHLSTSSLVELRHVARKLYPAYFEELQKSKSKPTLLFWNTSDAVADFPFLKWRCLSILTYITYLYILLESQMPTLQLPKFFRL